MKAKAKQEYRITVRLKPVVRDDLMAEAEISGMTKSTVINQAILTYAIRKKQERLENALHYQELRKKVEEGKKKP